MMWALPTLKQLNAQAESRGFGQNLKRACKTGRLDGEELVCEWQNHDTPSKCDGELFHYLYYDIFSEKPKGILTLCEHHDGYYGSPSEGYFECAGCNRVHVENITWERYEYVTPDGESLCLPCALKWYLGDEDHWLQLTDAVIDGLTFNQVRKAKHLIGVQMPRPGLEFRGNTEFDSMDGHCISGGGVAELQELMRQAKAEGYTKAVVILDGAYQFAVSLGLYVPEKSGEFDTSEQPEMAEGA
jgi:hypothetical protein